MLGTSDFSILFSPFSCYLDKKNTETCQARKGYTIPSAVYFINSVACRVMLDTVDVVFRLALEQSCTQARGHLSCALLKVRDALDT